MKNAGKARSYGLYRHLRTSKEIIENLLNYSINNKKAFRDLLSVVERFFNIQGRFPAQYWRTTATTLPSTSHSRPSMGW